MEALLEEMSVLDKDESLKAAMYPRAGDLETENNREADKLIGIHKPGNEKYPVDRNIPSGNRAHFLPELLVKSTRNDYNADIQVINPKISTLEDEQVNVLISGDEYLFSFTTIFNEKLKNVCFRIVFSSQTGQLLGAMNSMKTGMELPVTEPGEQFSAVWKFRCNLLNGYYYVGITVYTMTNEGMDIFALITDALVFRVIETDRIQQGGFVRMDIQPEITRLNAVEAE